MKYMQRIKPRILLLCLSCMIVLGAGCSEDNPLIVFPQTDARLISIEYFNWYPASPPVDPVRDGHWTLDDRKRDRIFWYKIEPTFGTHIRDLNPSISTSNNTLITTLDIEADTVSLDPDNWVGIMTGFEGCGIDLSGYQYLEIWINDFKEDAEDRGGHLYIDIGRIDEDFFEPADNLFNNEDRNRDGFTPLTEDTGLDGIFNVEGDTSEDDYNPVRIKGRFSAINGTERNLRHDTEDLNRSGVMDTENCYVTYTIDLADSAEQDIRRDYPGYEGFSDPVHEKDSWRQYKIDLSSGIETGVYWWSTCSVLQNVQHIRIWFRNVGEVVQDENDPGKRRLQIAIFKFIK